MSAKVTTQGVERAVLEAATLEHQLVELIEKLEAAKGKIQKYFDDTGKSQITVVIDSVEEQKEITAKKSEKMYINYDVDKLSDALDPEMFTEVTKKTYMVNNIGKLVGLCKQAGIKPKAFKSLLTVTTKVDSEAIKRLYAAKELSLKDIKGCYEAKLTKSIKIIEGGKN